MYGGAVQVVEKAYGVAHQSVLPALVILLPLLGFFLILLMRRGNGKLVGTVALVCNVGALFLLLAMIPEVEKGKVLFQLSDVFYPFGLKLEVDFVGLFMCLLSAFLWVMATIYSLVYMEKNLRRYYAFFELTLVGCLGVYLAGEFFSLFVFFEIFSLFSAVLVYHDETEHAIEAGNLYLYLGVFGGLALLGGLVIFYFYGRTLEFDGLAQFLPENPVVQYVAAFLLLIGFGIKAGFVPLHIWLPQAHPVAPTPASALLSGVMIKAGAYGVYLTLGRVFAGSGIQSDLGYIVIWIGILTMLVGAFAALGQVEIKRLLAYSSVSQMGYIVLALGLYAFLGEHGFLGFIGAFFHILNHAIFKVGLFFIAGIIYLGTHEKRLDRLSGLLRKMPVVGEMFLLFAGGLIGLPGFSAYGSKTLIHHALSEAIHYKGGLALEVIEILFILTGAFTFAYVTKFYLEVFHGKDVGIKIRQFPFGALKRVTLPLAFSVVFVGVLPKFFVKEVFLPMFAALGGHLEEVEEFFGHFSFWNWGDLSGVVPYIVIGILLYLVERRWRFFSEFVPSGLGIGAVVRWSVKVVAGVVRQSYEWWVGIIGGMEKAVQDMLVPQIEKLVQFDRDPKSTRFGPISIACLDFSKLWLTVVIVMFLLLPLLKMIRL